METYSSKISENGGDELMSSRQGSLVKSTAWQERDLEIKMTVTSGRKCFVSSKRLDPLGLLVKMLLESSRWYSPARRLRWEVTRTFAERVTRCTRPDKSTLSSRSNETSHQSDIPSSQLLYRLVPLERPTEETGCGLLPTVQTQGLKICNKNGKMEFFPVELLPTPMAQDYRRRGPNSEQQGLPEMAYNGMLPTPTAIDSGSGRINKSISPNAKERPTIALAAKMGLLPTPNASEATKYTKTYNPNSQMGKGLHSLAVNGMLTTPKAQESRGNVTKDRGKFNLTDEICKVFDLAGKTSLQLNPLFVEEMMGFPQDYLVLPFQDGDENR